VSGHRNRTLWLCAALHGISHAYQVALIPLYVLIQKDLGLSDDGLAPLVITMMGIAYCLPSYPIGILADRLDRKTLLAAGLMINALAFVALAACRSYAGVMTMAIVAGIGGSFFHPCATSLIARLFPEATGKALGRMGIGAGVGFFIGPIYAGWRAETSGWRAPAMELGLAGAVMALAFWKLAGSQPAAARPSEHSRAAENSFSTPAVWLLLIGAATLFSLRDFAGCAMSSLGSLFLQHAHHFSAKETGAALSCVFLAAAVSNPLFGSLSDRGRNRWAATALIIASVAIAAFPWFVPGWFGLAYAAYGFFFMASYPMVEAGLMEATPDSMRGRAFGLFLTAGGIVGNLGHWRSGKWVEAMGGAAASARTYAPYYAGLALLVLASACGLFCLRGVAVRRRQGATEEPKTPAFEKS